MEELLTRFADHFMGRLHGPLTLRFVLQPIVAILLAARAGLRDARDGRPPYFYALVTSPEHRRDMLRDGWKDIGKVFLIAIALDIVYQLIVLRWVYPTETLIVAALLALVPYLLFRGVITRLARAVRGERASQSTSGTPS